MHPFFQSIWLADKTLVVNEELFKELPKTPEQQQHYRERMKKYHDGRHSDNRALISKDNLVMVRKGIGQQAKFTRPYKVTEISDNKLVKYEDEIKRQQTAYLSNCIRYHPRMDDQTK